MKMQLTLVHLFPFLLFCYLRLFVLYILSRIKLNEVRRTTSVVAHDVPERFFASTEMMMRKKDILMSKSLKFIKRQLDFGKRLIQ